MTDSQKENDSQAEIEADGDASEQALANLVTELADRSNKGETINLDSVCKQYPQFESDLRELWGTIIVTDVAAKEQSSREQEITNEIALPQLELPCKFANYMLEAEIGRGGMGIVYRAIRESDGAAVAIKMILKGDFATKSERQRFDSEAIAASRLQHPNIIPIYEIGDYMGREFFCMKLIQGQSLSERLARGPMPANRAAKLMEEISDAIYYAHNQGILHRDLKPSNTVSYTHLTLPTKA